MSLVSFLPPTPVDVPHEPGNRIFFRRPRGEDVRLARHVAESDGRKGVRDYGAEIVKAMQTDTDDDRFSRRVRQLQREEREQEYLPEQFDRLTLLKASIVGWHGPQYLDPISGEMADVNEKTIAELDEQTARWAHHHIVDLIKPATQEMDKRALSPAASSA